MSYVYRCDRCLKEIPATDTPFMVKGASIGDHSVTFDVMAKDLPKGSAAMLLAHVCTPCLNEIFTPADKKGRA